jgi:hypothetical protein
VAAGASVAAGAGEPQAASSMLASTNIENIANSFFIFLLLDYFF